ncbi:aldo/keto reductase [soil metagenome]
MKIPELGFGCYRIDIRVDEHRKALKKAILEGITLIDTSANYSDGNSELLVGEVINDLISDGKIKREDITIVTKAGYIQGSNYRHATELKNKGNGFPDVVEYADRLWHSIHPDFLQDQLDKQLQRLNSDHIDSYLLHNPEYYLGWAKKNNIEQKKAQDEYYRRIKEAFIFLEEKVKEGRLKTYGISSNTFPTFASQYDHTSLEKVIKIANTVSPNNHFRYIQLPFNFFESGAVLIKNQFNNTKTVLETAYENSLVVLINRPLNAITSKGLVRLADYELSPYSEKEFIKQMKLVTLMEEDLMDEKLKNDDNLSEQELKSLAQYLNSGKTIEENWKFFGSIEHLNDNIEQFFAPKINYLNVFFNDRIEDENTRNFYEKYLKELYLLLNYLTSYYKISANERSKFIHKFFNEYTDEKYHSLTLSQKAILTILSVNGVNCVLIGARKEKYVSDVIKLNNIPKIGEETALKIFNRISNEINSKI